jgi:carbon-monoxide dehydrogenase iron sulfur subunit
MDHERFNGLKKVFLFEQKFPLNCTGCRTCEAVCSFVHEKAINFSKTRIKVFKDERLGIDRPVVCRHCYEPLCSEACPTKAISGGGDESLKIDVEKCVGCGSCVEGCPFGAIHIHPELHKAIACDLCGGKPRCVEWCPTGVLYFVDDEELSKLKAHSYVVRATRARVKQEREKWREITKKVVLPKSGVAAH